MSETREVRCTVPKEVAATAAYVGQMIGQPASAVYGLWLGHIIQHIPIESAVALAQKPLKEVMKSNDHQGTDT